MDPAEAAAWAAWAGAAVTAGGGYFTFRQARTAKEALRETQQARQIASDQAQSARESATHASKSADATIWQAKNVETQTKIAQAQLDRTDQPEFDFTAEPVRDNRVVVTARMTKGPVGLAVQVRWFSKSIVPEGEGTELWTMDFDEQDGTHQVVRYADVPFGVSVPSKATRGEIQVTLNCQELGAERTWLAIETVRWERPVVPWVAFE